MATTTHNLARLAAFASGSQRNNCRDISKETISPTASAMRSSSYFVYRRGVRHRAFEAGGHISGGRKQSDGLNPVREERQRDGRAGEKKKRGPDQVIDDLRLLHGVGDAGDDQPERRERRRANGDQQKHIPEDCPRSSCGRRTGKSRISITMAGNDQDIVRRRCSRLEARLRLRVPGGNGEGCLARGT